MAKMHSSEVMPIRSWARITREERTDSDVIWLQPMRAVAELHLTHLLKKTRCHIVYSSVSASLLEAIWMRLSLERICVCLYRIIWHEPYHFTWILKLPWHSCAAYGEKVWDSDTFRSVLSKCQSHRHST